MKNLCNLKKSAIVLTFILMLITSALTVCANSQTSNQQNSNQQSANQQIIVNGQVLADYPITINNCTLVPVRAVSDILGFEVIWNGTNQTATIKAKEMQTVVSLGDDLYSAQSISAIGMTAPTTLGSAPLLINDKLYVPAEIFRIIQGNDPDTLQITDTQVIINNAKEIEN